MQFYFWPAWLSSSFKAVWISVVRWLVWWASWRFSCMYLLLLLLICNLSVYIYCCYLGESIPIRLFLSGYELTPTMRDINKKFSVRYYLNLVLVDEEERRYFKQQVWYRPYRYAREPFSTAQVFWALQFPLCPPHPNRNAREPFSTMPVC